MSPACCLHDYWLLSLLLVAVAAGTVAAGARARGNLPVPGCRAHRTEGSACPPKTWLQEFRTYCEAQFDVFFVSHCCKKSSRVALVDSCKTASWGVLAWQLFRPRHVVVLRSAYGAAFGSPAAPPHGVWHAKGCRVGA